MKSVAIGNNVTFPCKRCKSCRVLGICMRRVYVRGCSGKSPGICSGLCGSPVDDAPGLHGVARGHAPTAGDDVRVAREVCVARHRHGVLVVEGSHAGGLHTLPDARLHPSLLLQESQLAASAQCCSERSRSSSCTQRHPTPCNRSDSTLSCPRKSSRPRSTRSFEACSGPPPRTRGSSAPSHTTQAEWHADRRFRRTPDSLARSGR